MTRRPADKVHLFLAQLRHFFIWEIQLTQQARFPFEFLWLFKRFTTKTSDFWEFGKVQVKLSCWAAAVKQLKIFVRSIASASNASELGCWGRRTSIACKFHFSRQLSTIFRLHDVNENFIIVFTFFSTNSSVSRGFWFLDDFYVFFGDVNDDNFYSKSSHNF